MRALSSAEIIAVGSELLTPTRIDTNSLAITDTLNQLGIEVRAKAIVGDRRARSRGRLPRRSEPGGSGRACAAGSGRPTTT